MSVPFSPAEPIAPLIAANINAAALLAFARHLVAPVVGVLGVVCGAIWLARVLYGGRS